MLIKHAYTVLSDPHLREEYNKHRSHHATTSPTTNRREQRAAEIVSLEEFVHSTSIVVINGETPALSAANGSLEKEMDVWTYGCRCGASYQITEDQLEEGVHLIGCQGCSEVVWVGYEPVEEDEDE